MALPGTLTLDDADRVVDQGTDLHFAYTVPTAEESAKNWVGLFPGTSDGPTAGDYVTYVYAPGTSGTATLSSGRLGAGDYQAFYLFDDGYEPLADPVRFTVRETPQLPAPGYNGDFGQHDLASPEGLTLDDSGAFWVADTRGRRVRRFGRRGRLRDSLGHGVLREPRDVAVAGGRVFVVDSGLGTVEVFTTRGKHVASLGEGQLIEPRGVAVEGPHRLLVSDVGHNRVARIDTRHGEVVGEITTGVHIPHGIAVDGERTWVVSSSRQYDGDCGVTCFVEGKPTITLGYGQHSYFGAMSNPAHVAIGRRGLVLVTVPDYGLVSRFRPTGAFVGEFGTGGRGLLRTPQGIAVGRNGAVFVADTGHHRIVSFGGTR